MLLSGEVRGAELTSLAKEISFAKKQNKTRQNKRIAAFSGYIYGHQQQRAVLPASWREAGGTDAGGMRSVGSPARGADPHRPLAPAPSARRTGLEAQQHHGREPASLRPKVGLIRLLPNGISDQMNPAAAFDEKHLCTPPPPSAHPAADSGSANRKGRTTVRWRWGR